MFRASLFCFLFVIVLTPYSISAMTAEQKATIRNHFETVGMECIKDNPINEDDINNLRAKKLPTGENAPCFLACMLKNVGVMDDNGLLQKDTALELAKKVFNNEEEMKLIGDYLHSCAHVNTDPVGDGNKGCDRAMLAYKCMSDNAAQFGFDM